MEGGKDRCMAEDEETNSKVIIKLLNALLLSKSLNRVQNVSVI